MNKSNFKFFIVMVFSLFLASQSFGQEIKNIELMNWGIGAEKKIYKVESDETKPPPKTNYPSYPVKTVPNYNNKDAYTGNECVVLKAQYQDIKYRLSQVKPNANKILKNLIAKKNSRKAFYSWLKRKGISKRTAIRKGYNGTWWRKAINNKAKRVKANAKSELIDLRSEKRDIVNEYKRLCK